MVQLGRKFPAWAGLRAAAVLAVSTVCAGSGIAYAQSPTPTPTSSTATTTVSVSSAIKATTGTASSDATTTAITPPIHVGRLAPGDEAAAVSHAMDRLTTVSGTDVQIGYRLGPPAGWYQLEGSTLVWHEPSPSDTHKLTVTVQDAADLRIIPSAKVTASLTGPAGKTATTTHTLNFLWDRDFYQYGANFALPEEMKNADLHVRVEPPSFRRNDQVLGAFFAEPVTHVFSGIDIPAPTRPDPKPGVPTTRGLFSEGRHPYVEPTPYPGATAVRETTGTAAKTK